MIKLSLQRKNTPYTSKWVYLWFNDKNDLLRFMQKKSDGENHYYITNFTKDYNKQKYIDFKDYLFNHLFSGFYWNNETDSLDQQKLENLLAI